uniref:Glycoside hydrolase family 127 protein n=1 Tax=Roseihalotalea indica TaxID=2867963 RepID=A0AA49GMF1_9BACT|nr:glycoside hydrolase family 127 protein [Tunicatimonas sp. TK19036]
MSRQLLLATFFSLGIISLTSYSLQAQGKSSPSSFVKPVYDELPLGAIKPVGWLKHQLEIMRDGTTGHLDEVHAKIAEDNGWLGGQGDGWEETPYWLDGAVPLAYLLDDARLKDKVLQYINWTLENQRPSGYFGPITKAEREQGTEITTDNCGEGEDWWPKMVMLKVLQQYYEATNDERVINFMTKYFAYQKASLEQCPIGTWTEWAKSRGADNVMMAQWLYQHTNDESLLELAGLIEEQSYAWSEWFGNRDWVIWAAAQQNGDEWMRRHAVNVGMALKSPAINYQRTHDQQYLDHLKTGFTDLMTLHGLPMGIFSGDEDLHGNDPVQGVELCAVVESMYSLEKIISITGDPFYMDALERMTFNVLPAQTTDDYNAKQYFQIANQVKVDRGVFDFSLPFSREMNNVFGMRSGYTCCLANMHQSWTKFTTHLWYGTPDGGLAALEYSPNEVTATVGEDATEVTIREETNYPFEDEIRFTLNTSASVSFPWQLRIPAWCEEAIISINGEEVQREKGGEIVTLEQTWQDGDQVTLQLPMAVRTSNWGRNSRSVERGPLVYALKLNERWEKGHDEEEGDYFSIFPEDDWNYGLLKEVMENPTEHLEVKEVSEVTDDFVWNLANAPIEITAPARKIPEWKRVNDVAHIPVSDRSNTYRGEVAEEIEQITLVPFGCTKIRVVAFPLVP